jgi:hypothetical protein
MSFEVIAVPRFRRELKKLAKRYPSLREEFAALITELSEHPDQGVALGNNCFKIRLAIASKGKGKSGGARVITYLHVTQQACYLLSIYDKSEKETISASELRELLQGIP